jgi:hypothetical protein
MFKKFLEFICCGTGTDIDIGKEGMTSFWTFWLVIATLLLVWAAIKQLSKIRKTTNADLIQKYNNEFFVESTRNIIMLLDNNALSYHEKEIITHNNCKCNVYQYFLIDDKILNQLELSPDVLKDLREKRVYTCYEIDDLLLGKFEAIGLFLKQGFMNKKYVFNHFSWYMELAWTNTEIQKYINKQRETHGPLICYYFQYARKICHKYFKSSKKWYEIKENFIQ